jgi:two-component system sensor histidine kinase HydH
MQEISNATGDSAPTLGDVPTAAYGSWARRGWMATTALLALALMVNALLSFAGSRRAIDGLNRGQADLLGATLREMLATRGALTDSAVVAQFFATYEERGLRYVALTDEGIFAGEPASDALEAPLSPPRDSAFARMPLLQMHDRLRAFFPGPFRAASGAQPPSYMVIDFLPTAAERLMQNARRTLALAVASAIILSFAALVFLRTSIRYEEARFRLQQQRHLALLGEMSAVLAHEIRNPLAALKGHAQLAYERLANATREKTCVGYVIENSERLEALTSDLLSFARSAPATVTHTDPVELMRAAARDVFTDEAIVVHTAGVSTTWPLDAERVRQALVNVLANARHVCPEGEAPEIRVMQRADQLVFEVRDFGPGLPSGREARIFDPFFTTRANGTGLGLAVASRVAAMHGGRITANNHHDAGAVFRLTIPRRA